MTAERQRQGLIIAASKKESTAVQWRNRLDAWLKLRAPQAVTVGWDEIYVHGRPAVQVTRLGRISIPRIVVPHARFIRTTP